jgi:hypothetical protein
VDLAALGVDGSNAELAEVQRQLHQDLHKAYFAGVLARNAALLLKQILDILGEIEQDKRRAFELGLVNKLSILEIETQISGVRRQLVQAREAYLSAREAVALYTDLEKEGMELSSSFRFRDHHRFSLAPAVVFADQLGRGGRINHRQGEAQNNVSLYSLSARRAQVAGPLPRMRKLEQLRGVAGAVCGDEKQG